MTAAAIMCGGFLVAVRVRGDFAAYQFTLLASFVVALTISGELLETLPLYALASVLPLVFAKKPYTSLALIYILAMVTYCAVGVLFQSPYASITVLLSRSLQFIAFFIVLENAKASIPPRLGVWIVVVAVAVESAVGIYLRLTGSVDGYGHIRLVSNAQPITGNISVFVMPLIGWLYYRGSLSSGARLGLLCLSTCLLFWVLLSGTRGYILLFGGCYAILVVDALLGRSGGKNWGKAGMFVLFVLLAVLAIAFGVYQEKFVLAIEEALGTNVSLGVREQENQVEASFFTNAPLVTKLLGIGTGGSWGDYPSYVAAVQEVFGSESWAVSSYLSRVGTAFHNYYADTLGLEGIIGIALLAGVAASMLGAVRSACRSGANGRGGGLCIFLTAYVALFFLMLYYRWSADCGVGELIMLAYVLNLCRAEAREGGERDRLPGSSGLSAYPAACGPRVAPRQGLRRGRGAALAGDVCAVPHVGIAWIVGGRRHRSVSGHLCVCRNALAGGVLLGRSSVLVPWSRIRLLPLQSAALYDLAGYTGNYNGMFARVGLLLIPFLCVYLPQLLSHVDSSAPRARSGRLFAGRREAASALILVVACSSYVARLLINNIGSTMPYELFF